MPARSRSAQGMCATPGPYHRRERATPLFTIGAFVGHPLPVYGSGRNRREWIHVHDHAEALLAVLRAKGVEGETFNIGTGERKSTSQIARSVVDTVRKPRGLISRVADRPGHVKSHAVDSGKIRRRIGWKTTRTVAAGLPGAARWVVENAGWWRNTVRDSGRAYFEERYPGLVPAVEKLCACRRRGLTLPPSP